MMFGKPCLVKGCRNHTSQGTFIGEICSPCFDMLISGNPKYGMSFVHEMQNRVEELEAKLAKVLAERDAAWVRASFAEEQWALYAVAGNKVDIMPDDTDWPYMDGLSNEV